MTERSLLAWLRSAVTNNFGLKLGALFAAILMFSLVRGAEDAQRSIFVDLITILPPDSADQMLVSELPDRVRVTVKGSRSQVNDLDQLNAVEIDISEQVGERYYYFADDEFEVPAGMSIAQIAPASIPLRWSARKRRTVPIRVALGDSTPRDGLALGQPARVDPPAVTIVGAAAEVDRLRSIETEPIDLSNYDVGRTERTVRLVRPPQYVEYEEDDRVEVTVEVVRDLAERSLPAVSIEVPEGHVISPERVTVTLRGAPSEVDLVDPAHIVAFIEVGELEPGVESSTSVRVRGVAASIELLGVSPNTVTVTRQP